MILALQTCLGSGRSLPTAQWWYLGLVSRLAYNAIDCAGTPRMI